MMPINDTNTRNFLNNKKTVFFTLSFCNANKKAITGLVRAKLSILNAQAWMYPQYMTGHTAIKIVTAVVL